MIEFWLGVAVGVIPTFFVTRWLTETRVGVYEARRVWRRRKAYRE